MSDSPISGSASGLGVINGYINIKTEGSDKAFASSLDSVKDFSKGLDEFADKAQESATSASKDVEGFSTAVKSASLNTRSLLTASRLLSTVGLRDVAKISRVVGQAGMISNQFESIKDSVGGLVTVVSGLGEVSLKAITSTIGLDSALASEIVTQGALTAGIGILAIAGTALIIVIKLITDTFQSSQATVKDAIKDLDLYYKTIKDGTTASTKIQLEKAEKDLKNAQDEKETVDKRFKNAKAVTDDADLNPLKYAFGDNAKILADATAEFYQYSSKSKELDTTIKKLTGDVTTYQEVLKNQGTADNDAREAAEKALAAKITNQKSEVEEAVKTADEIKTASSKSLQKQLDDLAIKTEAEQEYAIKLREDMNKAVSSGDSKQIDEVNKAIDENNSALKKDTDAYKKLNEVILPAVQNRELETTIIKGLVGAIDSGVNGLKTMSTEVTKFSEVMGKINEATKNYNEQETKVKDSRQLSSDRSAQDKAIADKRSLQDWNKRLHDEDMSETKSENSKMLSINQNYSESIRKEQENIAKETLAFNKNWEQKEKDHQDQLLQIQKDGHVSLLNDAADLNARAVFNDQQKTNKALTDSTNSFEKQKAQATEQENQKIAEEKKNGQLSRDQQKAQALQSLADQKQQFAEKRAQEIADRQQSLTRASEDAKLRLSRQKQDEALQDAERKKAYEKQKSDLLLGLLNPEAKLKMQNYQQQTAATNTFLKGMTNAFSTSYASIQKGLQANISNTTKQMLAGYGPVTTGNQANNSSYGPVTGSKINGTVAVISQYGRLPNGRNFASGIAGQGLSSDMVIQAHKSETINNQATSSAIRSMLGNNFSQNDLVNAVNKGKNGGTGINIYGNISPVFNNTGSYTLEQLQPLIEQGLEKTLTHLAGIS